MASSSSFFGSQSSSSPQDGSQNDNAHALVRNFMRMAEEQNLDQVGIAETNGSRDVRDFGSTDDDGFEHLLLTTAIEIWQDPRYHKQLQEIARLAEKRILNTGRIVEICFSSLYQFLKNVGQKLWALCQNNWIKIALFLLLGFLLLVAVKRLGIDANAIVEFLAGYFKSEFAECLTGRAMKTRVPTKM